MKKSTALKLSIVSLLGIQLAITAGCGSSSSSVSLVDPELGCGPVLTTNFTQPGQPYTTDKLDLLFLTDTSPRQVSVELQIVTATNLFLAQTGITDTQVGVMLAHGSASSLSGELYETGSAEGKVLDPASGTFSDDLLNKLNKTVEDLGEPTSSGPYASYNGSDGGEAGLVSLYNAMQDSHFTSSQGEGFFREDAALGVVVISDENDICFDMPNGVADPDMVSLIGGRVASREVLGREANCGPISDAAVVVDAVRARQLDSTTATPFYRPMLLGGVVNNDPGNISPGPEAGLAYGYLDIFDLAGGGSVNIASDENSIMSGVSALGAELGYKLTRVTEFVMPTTNVASKSVKVNVGGALQPVKYVRARNQINLSGEQAGGLGSNIEIQYRALNCK